MNSTTHPSIPDLTIGTPVEICNVDIPWLPPSPCCTGTVERLTPCFAWIRNEHGNLDRYHRITGATIGTSAYIFRVVGEQP